MINITTISNGEKTMELSDKMVKLINEYSNCLTGFEMIGVLEVFYQNKFIKVSNGVKKWIIKAN